MDARRTSEGDRTRMRKLFEQGHTKANIARITQFSRKTVIKRLKKPCTQTKRH